MDVDIFTDLDNVLQFTRMPFTSVHFFLDRGIGVSSI